MDSHKKNKAKVPSIATLQATFRKLLAPELVEAARRGPVIGFYSPGDSMRVREMILRRPGVHAALAQLQNRYEIPQGEALTHLADLSIKADAYFHGWQPGVFEPDKGARVAPVKHGTFPSAAEAKRTDQLSAKLRELAEEVKEFLDTRHSLHVAYSRWATKTESERGAMLALASTMGNYAEILGEMSLALRPESKLGRTSHPEIKGLILNFARAVLDAAEHALSNYGAREPLLLLINAALHVGGAPEISSKTLARLLDNTIGQNS